MTKQPKKTINFETSLKQLETILKALESETSSDLNKQMALFQEGMKLVKQCQEKLSTAEQQVTTALCNTELSTHPHHSVNTGSDANHKVCHDTDDA